MIKWLFYIYSIILVLLAVLPINSSGSSINDIYVVSIRLDYLLHCAVFIPWMFLWWKYTGVSFRGNIWLTFFYIFLGMFFAFVNEAVQYVLPYRAYNVNDLLANGGGILLGAGFFIIKHNMGVTKEGG